MLFTKDIPSTELGIQYTIGEVREVIDEIKKLNFWGIYNELCDVYTCLMINVTTYTSLNIPILWSRSAHAWIDRIQVWERIFEEEGLVFNKKYLINGGNYKKIEKINMALDLAKQERKSNKYEMS